MNQKEEIVFYLPSRKSSLREGERSEAGWQRCIIYQGRHMPRELGYNGSMKFVKLSDGRVILTNDLWDDVRGENRGWFSAVPKDGLTGCELSTRTCQPGSKESIEMLVELLDVRGGNFKIPQGCLSDKEAYELKKNHSLPEITSRKYRDETTYSSFSSPEGAVITHLKCGSGDVEPLEDLSQLHDANPDVEPVFLLYTEDTVEPANILEKGDEIDETYVYDKPEWTQGQKKAASVKTSSSTIRSVRAYDRYDYDYAGEEEEFTPYSGHYRTGNGDFVYAFQGEQPDYTACDSECGYCGRCYY